MGWRDKSGREHEYDMYHQPKQKKPITKYEADIKNVKRILKKKKKIKGKKLGSGSHGGKWVTMGGKHIFIPS